MFINVSPKQILNIVLFFSLLTVFSFRQAYAFSNDWKKGVTIRLAKETPSQIEATLKEIKAVGADHVAITPGWITKSTTSHNVDRKDRTPTDSLMIFTITKAHELGLKVMLKPHLDLESGTWRANLDPTNKSQFFINYKKMLLSYSEMAEKYDVELLCVGAELFKLTNNPSNDSYWKDLIGSVRTVYNGKLTYSSNFSSIYYEETKGITFFHLLDYVGLSAYTPLSTTNNTSVEDLVKAWEKTEKDRIIPLLSRINKPLLITEIGYRSVDGTAKDPGNYSVGSKLDTKEQKDLYSAFFNFWISRSYMSGMFIWDWSYGSAKPSSTDYSLKGKPALDVIKTNFTLELPTEEEASPVPSEPAPLPSEEPLPDVYSEYEIEIHYPKDKSEISGERKVKVALKDLKVTEYNLVLKSGNNEFSFSNSGDFKQSKIDFDKWNWNAKGPYVLNFIATDPAGNPIATKSITIYLKK